jgi:beta-galactosidase
MPAGDAEGDVTGRRWEQRVEVMRDAIVYNRNNPSILFYESGNKGVSDEHMADMKAVRDQFDPHGGRAAGSREMLASKVAEYGGEMLYINKSATKPVWAMEYSRDEGARKYQDDFTAPFHKDSPDYNRNQDSHAVENVRRWYDYWRERPGGGDRVSSGGVNIVWADSNTHFRGDNNYRRSGEVDAMRLPKEGFYAHQVMWDGWVDVEHQRSHIVGHWNYAPGTVKDVFVVVQRRQRRAAAERQVAGPGREVGRLPVHVQGRGLGAGDPARRRPRRQGQGSLLVRSGDHRSGCRLRLTPKTGPAGWRADASDLALVDVEVVDAKAAACRRRWTS